MPKRVTVLLHSTAPYQCGRFIRSPRLPRETAEAHEERCWLERAHLTTQGQLFIPPMALKKSLETATVVSKEQIPGQGRARYTNAFLAGLRCTSGPVLDVTREQLDGEWVLVPPDGKRGGSKRVKKCFPTVQTWQGEAEFLVIDDLITKDVFERHCRIAGQLVGIGVWRPEKGGLHGTFEPVSFRWEELVLG